MKKLLAFAILPLLLIGCENSRLEDYKTFDVNSYVYSYETSEVQEYTYDCYIAVFNDDIKQLCYVEVPYEYHKITINVKYTGKLIWYRVYGSQVKVYNNGWELAKI